VEGRVAVANDSAGEGGVAEHNGMPVPAQKAVPPTFVSAGQQVVVTEDAVATPVSADIVSATAWIQHRLIFDGSRLNDVVEDFNRYNTRQIRVEDPMLEDFHISGTYSSTDPTSLLRFLRDQPGIRVIEADDGVRITRK
jgi:transmembrane sensor